MEFVESVTVEFVESIDVEFVESIDVEFVESVTVEFVESIDAKAYGEKLYGVITAELTKRMTTPKQRIFLICENSILSISERRNM